MTSPGTPDRSSDVLVQSKRTHKLRGCNHEGVCVSETWTVAVAFSLEKNSQSTVLVSDMRVHRDIVPVRGASK